MSAEHDSTWIEPGTGAQDPAPQWLLTKCRYALCHFERTTTPGDVDQVETIHTNVVHPGQDAMFARRSEEQVFPELSRQRRLKPGVFQMAFGEALRQPVHVLPEPQPPSTAQWAMVEALKIAASIGKGSYGPHDPDQGKQYTNASEVIAAGRELYQAIMRAGQE
jgi:hypothetical protein